MLIQISWLFAQLYAESNPTCSRNGAGGAYKPPKEFCSSAGPDIGASQAGTCPGPPQTTELGEIKFFVHIFVFT